MPCGLQARPKETQKSLQVWGLRKGKRRLVKTEISEQPEALTNKPLYSQYYEALSANIGVIDGSDW